MKGEMSETSFQAVRCSYCSEPIPLSARLLELCHFDSDCSAAEVQCHCQVFILRCEVCSKENRYLKAEIETVDEEPHQSSDWNGSGPRGYPQSLRKAAGQ
jgi:hypothetical protein